VFCYREKAVPIRPENKARYPKDWKLRSRFIRFIRAKNHCEWCGAENYKPHPVTGSKVVLTTAHVFDHRPEASNFLNLAALCQKCHNGHDAEMRRKNANKRRLTESRQMGLAL
jgi:hypothetical protein